MATTLILIVGNNNIANFLFARAVAERHPFVSTLLVCTDRTLVQAEWLDMALARGPSARVSIHSDDLGASVEALKDEAAKRQEDDVMVCVTGGTKVMSHAVCMAFPKARLFSVNQDLAAYYDFQSMESVPIAYNISLVDYMTVTGFRLECSNPAPERRDDAYRIFNNIRQKNFEWKESSVLNKIKSAASGNELNKYVSGEWFEEYCYWRIRELLGLPSEAIAQGVKFYSLADPDRLQNDNEMDVVFIYRNRLHAVECKVGLQGGKTRTRMLLDFTYKLAAVVKNLGLYATSFLIALPSRSAVGGSAGSLVERCRMLGNVRSIIYGEDLAENKDFLGIKR